jgi:hypothetical protein
VTEPAAAPASPVDKSAFPRERRFVFIQLLFSLTIAEVARQIAALYDTGRPVWEVFAAYLHLTLAAFVVAASWIGWSMSDASRRITVTRVSSREFVVLLLDLFLVVCYFMLVRGVEIPAAGKAFQASAKNECRWITYIFVGYFAWDVLTKTVITAPGEKRSWWTRFKSNEFWQRGVASLGCLLTALVISFMLQDVSRSRSVILCDIGLMFLVGLFRLLKEGRQLWAIAAAFYMTVIVIAAAMLS